MKVSADRIQHTPHCVYGGDQLAIVVRSQAPDEVAELGATAFSRGHDFGREAHACPQQRL